jgi:uncharacterized protein YhbP (UPF0306 family)
MDQRITTFIKEQSCISICCVDAEARPHAFTCFYTFDAEDGYLYFKSSEDTLHGKILQVNNAIAGSIVPNKLNPLQIKGIQLEGEYVNTDEENARGKKLYYLQHPYALATPGRIWCIKINSIKMTDNTLVFGEKIKWLRHN